MNEVATNKIIVKLGTIACNSTTQTNGNNVDINLDCKELKNEPFYIYEDKIIKYEEISTSVKNDIMHGKPDITAEKVTNKVNRRVSSRKGKKTNQVADDKKENLKKVNAGKVVRQKAPTKKSCKSSSKLGANQILKQEHKESLENYTKVDLYKINTEGCLKCNLSPFTHVKSQAKMYDTKFSCPNVTRQQDLNQYNLENTNVLQHLDYNSLKCTNQQAMSATNSWMTVPKPNENFALNNPINNTQTETGQSSCINDKHHAYTLATDYSWRQNENPYFNSIINSMDSYKLLAENKTYYPYNIYNPNCIWNNLYMQNFSRNNSTFQQTTSNVSPNYAVLPINASNNFLNPTATPFNPFYYYPPLLTDDNLKKLYYTSLSNNGCDLTVKKENVMPLLDNWHHSNSSMIPSNSSLNIPPTTSTWYNAPSSSFLDASTSTTSDADKEQFKCEQNAYLTNHYNADMTKASVYKNQWREKDQFVSYVKPAVQNTLPAITTILTPTPIGTYTLEPYKTDNGLTSNLTHHSDTVTSTNSMMSNIADFPSETTAVNVPEELNAPCVYSKDKKLISEVLESIL